MRIQLLHVPDCPAAPELLRLLRTAVARRADAHLDVRVITDEGQAVAAGMTGSPTLLVDGADPFAEADRPPSMSCRLYRDARGDVTRLPPETALWAVVAPDEVG